MLENRSAVEETIIDHQRQAHYRQAAENSAALVHNLGQGRKGSTLKDGLVKKIGTGVSGQAKFGKNQDADTLLLCPIHETEKVLDVAGTVGHPQSRHCGGDANEAVMGHGFIIIGKTGPRLPFRARVGGAANEMILRARNDKRRSYFFNPSRAACTSLARMALNRFLVS